MKTPHTLVIAEAGVNHNGSLAKAMRLVDAAAEAGADFVKFQSFNAAKLATATAPKAKYQRGTTDTAQSQLEMLRQLELSRSDYGKIIARCQKRRIKFLSTPFDRESLRFLHHDLRLPTIKLPSGELTNPLLLLDAARTGRQIILSTGMATLAEIELALGVLAFGYLKVSGTPSRTAFKRAYVHRRAHGALAGHVVLLHCTTEYPAPFADVDLRAMDTMRDRFGLPVGYSDHTPGIAISVAAAARGAVVIEKHLTLDRTLPGPDHRASIEPDDFARLVTSIREVEVALGDGRKICRPSEAKNRAIARKSLVAARDIARGEPLSAESITAKRPGTGRPVYDYWKMLGKRAPRNYRKDEPL